MIYKIGCSRGLARCHATKQRCSVAPAPKLCRTKKLLPCHRLRLRRSFFPDWQSWQADVFMWSKVSTAMGAQKYWLSILLLLVVVVVVVVVVFCFTGCLVDQCTFFHHFLHGEQSCRTYANWKCSYEGHPVDAAACNPPGLINARLIRIIPSHAANVTPDVKPSGRIRGLGAWFTAGDGQETDGRRPREVNRSVCVSVCVWQELHVRLLSVCLWEWVSKRKQLSICIALFRESVTPLMSTCLQSSLYITQGSSRPMLYNKNKSKNIHSANIITQIQFSNPRHRTQSTYSVW